MPKKIIIIIIQSIFLVCPILLLVFAVDYKSVLSVLQSIRFSIILLLIAILLVRFTLQSIRFWLLAAPFSKKIKMGEFIALDWKARYYAIIMPSSAGQDIARAVLLKNYLSAGEIAAVSVFFRITGIVTFILLSCFGFSNLYFEHDSAAVLLSVSVLLLAVVAISAVSFSERLAKKLLSVLPEKTPKKLLNFLENSSRAILLYKKFPKLVAFNLFFSFFLQVLYILFPIISIYAISGELMVVECLKFIPPIEIAAAAFPFSPSGAGIREGLLILFFDLTKQTKEQAFSYITLNALTYLISLAGFFVVLMEKTKGRKF